MTAILPLRRRLSRGGRRLLVAGLGFLAAQDTATAQQGRPLTTPKQHFGFDIGDDYRLANYTQFQAYWEKLARESDRMVLDTIGRTAEGRPQLMAIISSPANLAKREEYRRISERLARADGVDEAQARALAKEGKAIVWIDGGLHATETLGAHQLILTVWELLSKSDPETQRFLDDAIVLAVHANPDGMELVSNWYMREADSSKRATNIPRLYQKYIGHDNNRDFYMVTQPETENMTRIQYRSWHPQIVFNHHQTGPEGSVLFAPPFRGPHNHNFDPLIPLGIDLVGSAIHNRFAVEGKPGAVMREEAGYQTWWNGGLRTAVYFHNMIGLLTETIGSPTPMRIPFVPRKQIVTADNPNPIQPQEWRFRQSLAYSVSSNRAVLDVATKHREDFLFNSWRMGKNAIERGSRDEWTAWPRRVAALQEEIAKERTAQQGTGTAPGTQGRRSEAVDAKWHARFRDPAHRDPRAYVIPADQPDLPTAVKFVNTLMKTGVDVHRADAPLTVNGTRVPAGSFVVFAAQAFRPHVLDMFEPQDYPNDLQYPGGPPKAPYDNAGYTLAYQMGVRFERVLDALPGRFTKLTDFATVPAGTVASNPGSGWLLGRATNDAVRAAQRLLAQGEEVWWLEAPVTAGGRTHPAGTLYIPSKGSTPARLQELATELGVSFAAAGARPSATMRKLRRPRVALWDQYGGLMTSGWTRWIMERFELPYDVVYPGDVDGGALAKYDVVVLPDGSASANAGGTSIDPATLPAEFRGRVGAYSKEKTLPRLREFATRGGTILAIGSATSVGYDLGLPVEDALVERTPTGAVRSLPREKLFIPGSVLRVAVDSTHPVAAGMGGEADVLFDTSPVFRLRPDASRSGTRAVAWFANDRPLRSGWAWGQHHLAGGVAVVDAPLGRGRVILYGPEVLFRAQPHGTFKLFFNALMTGAAERAPTAD